MARDVALKAPAHALELNGLADAPAGAVRHRDASDRLADGQPGASAPVHISGGDGGSHGTGVGGAAGGGLGVLARAVGAGGFAVRGCVRREIQEKEKIWVVWGKTLCLSECMGSKGRGCKTEEDRLRLGLDWGIDEGSMQPAYWK